jgi:hypothetical protein
MSFHAGSIEYLPSRSMMDAIKERKTRSVAAASELIDER